MNTEIIINKLIDSIENLNADAVVDLLSENIVFHDMPIGITEGRNKVHDVLKNFFNAAVSIKWEILNKLIHGNLAVIERVNHILLKNGKKITLPIVTVAEIENSKIKIFRDYFDLKTFNDQVSG